MLRVLCPAKVNLFLSVGPLDSRGYHPIRTVFQAVSLYDELLIERSDVDSFESDAPLPDRNTVTRAWSLLREVAELPPLTVRLTKRIPANAGLGGGSSDAAGFLRGVATLLNLRLPNAELRSIALSIGADVPFFLHGGRQIGEGYGEILTRLSDPPETWMVIVKPPVDCPTGEMYSALDKESYDWMPLGAGPYNDFERVAPQECLDLISSLKEWGAIAAGLTGSGSAVYSLAKDRPAAELLATLASENGYRYVFVVEALGGYAFIVPKIAEVQ